MTISYENTEYEFTDEYVNIKIKGIEKKYDRVYFNRGDFYGFVYDIKRSRLMRVNQKYSSGCVHKRRTVKKMDEKMNRDVIANRFNMDTYWGTRAVYCGGNIAEVCPIIVEMYILSLMSETFKKRESEAPCGIIKKVTSKNGKTKYIFRNKTKVYDYWTDNDISLRELVEYVQKNAEKFRLGEKAEFVSKIITSRGKVYFEKIDKRTKGIDFIKVYVPVVSKQTEPDNKKIIEAYKRDRKQILGTVIKRIKETKRFQNLGVPINIFKLSNVTLTEQRELYFLFELKDELIQ